MSEPEKKPRNSYTAQIVYAPTQLNELMVKVRELAQQHRQFAVCERNGCWELSYIEVVA